MDLTFGFGGFNGGSFGVPNGFTNPSTVGNNVNGSVLNANAEASQPPWWQSLISDALGAYKTYSAVDLAGQQIKQGQYPSVISQSGTLGGTANVSGTQALSGSTSSWLLIAVIVVIAVLLLKR